MEYKNENLTNRIATIILTIILTFVPVALTATKYFNIPKMIILLACGLVLFVLLILKLKDLKNDKTDILIGAFVILAILSTVFSTNVTVSIFGADGRFEGLLIILVYLLVYFHAKYSFIKYDHFENICIFIYMAICFLSFLQYFFSDYINIPIISGRVNGTFGNSNFLGNFISIILPFFILKYITNGKNKYLFCSTISFCSMLMCTARSSWVAFAFYGIFTIIYVILKKDKELVKRFIILLIAFILSFMLVTMNGNTKVSKKFDNLFNELQEISDDGIKDNMGSGRIKIWKMTINLIRQKPILGCGVDNLYEGLIEYSTKDLAEHMIRSKTYIDKAHNEYLQIAATMGIPALIVYIGFISSILFPNIKNILYDEKKMILTTVICSYLIQAFFNISTLGVAPIFWFVLGIASRKNMEKMNTNS